MDEKKPVHIDPVKAPEKPSSGGINFDQLLISWAEMHNAEGSHISFVPSEQATDQTTTLLTDANATMRATPEWSAINISNIAIQNISREDLENRGKKLGISGIRISGWGNLWLLRYRRIMSVSIVVLVVSSLASVFLFCWKSYLDIASQPIIDPTYQSFVDYVVDYQKLWSEYTNLNDYSFMSSVSFVWGTATTNVDTVFNSSRLSYIQKKSIFQDWLNSIARDIIANSILLDALKKDITKYGFSPKELLNVFADEQEDVSIKNSLMSLEVVKFSAAIKVFSYLDTFIKWLANLLSLSFEEVQKKIQDLDVRWERDIKTYLSACYLNPYEIDENCNLVGDFNKYYTYYEKSSTFDVNFFKKLMYYIDLKLEQSDLPNFSITFQRFDPRQKEISFNVTVDTFKQDEASLIRQGIFNPHIFVVTQLLDLLKQSLFVIWENIDAKQLKIQQKIIQVGSTVFPANSSSMNFVLPIQKNSQREIADYILNKNYYLNPVVGVLATDTGANASGVVVGSISTGGQLTGSVLSWAVSSSTAWAITGVHSAVWIIQ